MRVGFSLGPFQAPERGGKHVSASGATPHFVWHVALKIAFVLPQTKIELLRLAAREIVVASLTVEKRTGGWISVQIG